MTKNERLQQLQDEKQLHNALDKVFDRDWRQFVNGVRLDNHRKNRRVIKAIAAIKGQEFAKDLLRLMKRMKEEHSLLQIARTPEGDKYAESRVSAIREVWVTMKQTGLYGRVPEGKVFIQVKKDRWVYFHFSLTK